MLDGQPAAAAIAPDGANAAQHGGRPAHRGAAGLQAPPPNVVPPPQDAAYMVDLHRQVFNAKLQEYMASKAKNMTLLFESEYAQALKCLRIYHTLELDQQADERRDTLQAAAATAELGAAGANEWGSNAKTEVARILVVVCGSGQGQAPSFRSGCSVLSDLVALSGEAYKAVEEVPVEMVADGSVASAFSRAFFGRLCLTSCSATVSHYEAKLQKTEVQRVEALNEAMLVLEEEISRLIDERDDLMQRIRFLERQLAKAQEGLANEVPLEHQATQTDDVEWGVASTTMLPTCAVYL
eukprot:jgi/Tetstr1/449930/TSEL_036984.t1